MFYSNTKLNIGKLLFIIWRKRDNRPRASSLKEKGSERASDSMKLSLFKYLLENQINGQIIIIENEIPQLDYSEANLIHFTKDVNNGRYGLLYGVTE